MGLREVGAVSFDDASFLNFPQLRLFDDQVVLGGCAADQGGKDSWVLRSYDLTKASGSELIPIPTARLFPAQDGYATAFALWFAEDDLAVFGMARESMVLHQWQGGVQQFSVPTMRPHIELDLSNGRARSAGALPPGRCFDVDLRRRRIVSWDPGMMCRIFQMT